MRVQPAHDVHALADRDLSARRRLLSYVRHAAHLGHRVVRAPSPRPANPPRLRPPDSRPPPTRCPLIILDLLFTTGARRKLPATMLTAACLIMGVVSRLTPDRMERWVIFAVSTMVFIIMCFMVVKAVTAVLVTTTPAAHADLQRALITLLVVWPVFPILWILGACAPATAVGWGHRGGVGGRGGERPCTHTCAHTHALRLSA